MSRRGKSEFTYCLHGSRSEERILRTDDLNFQYLTVFVHKHTQDHRIAQTTCTCDCRIHGLDLFDDPWRLIGMRHEITRCR